MLPDDPEATILKQLKGIPGTGDPAPVPDADPTAPSAPPVEGAAPPPEPAPDTGYRPTEQQQMDRLTAPTPTPN
jgi:hypothetical protein